MPGMELVVGYLVAWFVRKSRVVGVRVGAEADRVLDAGVDRLHDLVTRQLRQDPALRQLEREAGEEIDNPRTRQRVILALEEAAERDTAFAERLGELIGRIEAGVTEAHRTVRQSANASGMSTVIQAGRDVHGTWPTG